PQAATPGAHHGGDLSHAARRDRARRVPGAHATHLAHAAAQVLDRLEDVDHRVATQVAIVGGGYAGMASGVALAERGVKVTVYESGPVPGGRARRVRISFDGQGHELDNGQHIFVGAYTELFRLMRTVGVPPDALLRYPLEVRYARDFRLRSRWFPAPLGLVTGLLF